MSPIERLLTACVDDERVLSLGATLVGGRRGARLEALAIERWNACDELVHAGRTLHHVPRARGSFVGALRRASAAVGRFAMGSTEGRVIDGCQRSQARLEAVLGAALEEDHWSLELGGILEAQHRAVARARSVLAELG